MKKGLIVLLVVSFLFTSASAQSDGAPWPPQLSSPANGATASTNPPTLCVIDSGDPENEPVFIHFEVWGGGENDHQSDWISSPGKGQRICWKDSSPWSAETHSWTARAKDSNNNQSGAAPEWSVNIPAAPSAPPASCALNDFTRNPSTQTAGSPVQIHVAASCTNGVSKIVVSVEGNEIGTINGGDGNVTWDTSGLPAGPYTIRLQIYDNIAGLTKNTAENYDLTSPSAPPPPPPPQGPSINQFSFNPSGSANVGDNVTIHIQVGSSNPGAIQITVPCGSIAPHETTTPQFNATWSTNSCGAGSYKVTVCARDVNDQGWKNPTCSKQTYTLSSSGSNPYAPTATFTSDADTIQLGQCTNLHWTTTNANTVDIDGIAVASSGDMQVCPTVTKLYSLKADGPNGEATASLSIVVAAQGVITVVPENGPASTEPPQNPGGSSCDWHIGARVGLKAGAAIRVGSGMSYGIETIVPSDNWQVDIIGGPRSADGVTWWDVSRKNLDGGGTGWVYFEQASECNVVVATPGSQSNTPAPVTPLGTPASQNNNTQSGWCNVPIVGLFVCPPIVKGFGSELTPTVDPTTCTVHVYNKEKQIIDQCIGSDYPAAGMWDTWAATKISKNNNPCNISISTIYPSDTQAQSGDIVVWHGIDPITKKTCNDADAPGHVAIFRGWNGDGTMIMDSSNWTGDLNHVHIDSSCMALIHIPVNPNPQNGQSSPPNPQSSSPVPNSPQSSNQPPFCNWSWLKNILPISNYCNSVK